MKSPYYPDTEDQADESNSADESENQSQEGDKASKETTLVPMSMLKDGVEVGDTCTFKIVSIHGKEAEIEWDDSEDKDEGGSADSGDKSISESMMGSPMASRGGGGY